MLHASMCMYRKIPPLREERMWAAFASHLPDTLCPIVLSFLKPDEVCAITATTKYWKTFAHRYRSGSGKINKAGERVYDLTSYHKSFHGFVMTNFFLTTFDCLLALGFGRICAFGGGHLSEITWNFWWETVPTKAFVNSLRREVRCH